MNNDLKSKLEKQEVEPHVHGPHCNHGHSLEPIKRETPKLGRNDPCHCGSEKKFKKCCGK
ncbi:MAG: preprotein translocase subunit SecA [Bdellovibrionales bacterium CG12_big_fil_rev_8_21_14_0_65_38_15]|nr:MAG: preprotein translocase subunit SecA [Bdellovibrionales bacterium CG22_combo_CG10-13_8_21_14_all_38_13]PIQ57066.1 MAG: preprotein translocase subunit SecA [Bdellovibrionales bacterium CG12_big_fil_rev_8_21_14_0_65_38_15]PIR30096.1 MAG: preprotein translocase subunit SecA [Bdellovibrionales bacterium CG11_big_fil_rev_8_21_14_0_20_38_13]